MNQTTLERKFCLNTNSFRPNTFGFRSVTGQSSLSYRNTAAPGAFAIFTLSPSPMRCRPKACAVPAASKSVSGYFAFGSRPRRRNVLAEAPHCARQKASTIPATGVEPIPCDNPQLRSIEKIRPGWKYGHGATIDVFDYCSIQVEVRRERPTFTEVEFNHFPARLCLNHAGCSWLLERIRPNPAMPLLTRLVSFLVPVICRTSACVAREARRRNALALLHEELTLAAGSCELHSLVHRVLRVDGRS